MTSDQSAEASKQQSLANYDTTIESSQSTRSMSSNKKPCTLYEKILHNHIVAERGDGTVLLYIGVLF